MPQEKPEQNAAVEQDRLLVAAPTIRDGEITSALMASAGVRCIVCPTLTNLSTEIASGVGAILLSEYAFAAQGMDQLIAALHQQPRWSDIPVIALIQGGGQFNRASHVLSSLRNITLLERPAPIRSIVSAVQSALRARNRQYEMRDQIDEIARMAAEREQVLRREQAALRESERAGKMKDEFLATLSHELRTPLNAILGWSQLLRRADGDRELIAEGITVIERNTRVQVQLIEDLLDMSRIISGKVHLDIRPVEAESFIDAAIETVRPAAQAKNVKLTRIIRSGAGTIAGDSSRLQQVVWNLLSNSIKFTPGGGEVKLIVDRLDSQLQISVVDTGAGVDPKFLPHVFERFRQADSSTTRNHGGLGLGLGLAIVKHLVELHGGTVAATSAGEGQGSTFSVILPAASRAGDPSTGDDSPANPQSDCLVDGKDAPLKGIKILVVDDEPDARRLIKRLLESCGADVLTADSAETALAIIARERPDLLLSDIGMPVVDGYELLRRVRALGPERGGALPAIALTAFARSEDRTRALLAGFLLHVAKPVEPRELIATLATVAGRAG
jgi:signal transduction histidine kinase/CheY-like chemotaxis protein